MRGRLGRYMDERVTVRRVTVFVVALIEASIGFAMAVGIMQMTVVEDLHGHLKRCASGQDTLRTDLALVVEERDVLEQQVEGRKWIEWRIVDQVTSLQYLNDELDKCTAACPEYSSFECQCCEWEVKWGLACSLLNEECERWHERRYGF